MRVLIVDDNHAITDILQQIVENENHQTKTAFNGTEGYEAYLEFNPDFVITDVEMPDINGFELMKSIRQHNQEIKTVYMSGNLNGFGKLLEEEQIRYNAAFLSKPFSKKDLICLLGSQF